MKVICAHVRNEFLSKIKEGKKVIEGRLEKEPYSLLEPGDFMILYDEYGNVVRVRVKAVRRYDNFREMLEKEGLERVLPGVKSIEDGVKIYHSIYNDSERQGKKVLAIEIEIVDCLWKPLVHSIEQN